MAPRASTLSKSLRVSLLSSNLRFLTSVPSPEQSLKSAIETRNFLQIPNLLSSYPQSPKSNPFSFLSSFSHSLQTQIVDGILQSLIPLRPRSVTHATHTLLLAQFLSNPNPNSLPLSLAILQRSIRSGTNLPQQFHLSISLSWLARRRTESVAEILAEVRGIGYPPDRDTCNYLLSSLCFVDEITEAVEVLRHMRGARCEPDTGSYGAVIEAASKARRTRDVAEMMREMVGSGVLPRQRTVLRAVAAMRANAEVKRGKDMVRWLESEGLEVGFESHEMVVEGCLERREFILAGEAVLEMMGRGFIPYIGARQRVVEGLASIGQPELACKVRRRLAELGS